MTLADYDGYRREYVSFAHLLLYYRELTVLIKQKCSYYLNFCEGFMGMKMFT